MGEEARGNVAIMRREDVKKVEEVLRQKLNEPVPEPEIIPLKRAVRKWYPLLKELRDKGYTREMLVTVLAGQGINITKDKLSVYMADAATELGRSSGDGRQNGSVAPPSGERQRESRGGAQPRNSSFQMRPDKAL